MHHSKLVWILEANYIKSPSSKTNRFEGITAKGESNLKIKQNLDMQIQTGVEGQKGEP